MLKLQEITVKIISISGLYAYLKRNKSAKNNLRVSSIFIYLYVHVYSLYDT